MKPIFIYLITLSLGLFSCKNQDEAAQPKLDQDMEALVNASYPLENTADLDVLINEIGDSRYVLLGEASHGTAEYYTWRAEISKRLIEEKGFNIIAVEGDWPDMYRLNQYIKGSTENGANAEEVLRQMERWPTWMWANREVADLGDWLRSYNQNKAAAQQVGFYGLDVYSLWDSMEEVIAYLEENDPASVDAAREAYACFDPYGQDEWAYATATYGEAGCADELVSVLELVRENMNAAPATDEAAFNAVQNALTAVNAERYYAAAVKSNTDSWNIRDNHMVETINNLLEHHGNDAKIIVWEHNTHVGDARATDMAKEGSVNVGQLVREQHGADDVFIVGFGSYSGTVIAASGWGAPMQEMVVPEAQPGSWEAMLHAIEPANKIVLLNELEGINKFTKPIGHRAIGVVYNPLSEQGNYVPSVLPERYDAFIFIDETNALNPFSENQRIRQEAF